VVTACEEPPCPPATTVEIQVDGLACPFCAFEIEKRLKKVPGVTEVEGDVKNGRAIVEMEPGTAPDPAALADAIERAGSLSLSDEVPAESSQVVVTGRLHVNEEGIAFLEVEHTHEVESDEE